MSAIVPLPPIGDVETIPADVLLQALAEANAERAERLATVQILRAEGAELFGDGLDDRRVGVTERVDGDTAQ